MHGSIFSSEVQSPPRSSAVPRDAFLVRRDSSATRQVFRVLVGSRSRPRYLVRIMKGSVSSWLPLFLTRPSFTKRAPGRDGRGGPRAKRGRPLMIGMFVHVNAVPSIFTGNEFIASTRRIPDTRAGLSLPIMIPLFVRVQRIRSWNSEDDYGRALTDWNLRAFSVLVSWLSSALIYVY